MPNGRREYARGTYLDQAFPWGLFIGGRVLCSDGKVRALKRIASTADTFFSIPASVEVRRDGRRWTVAGYVTVETLAGYSTDSEADPAVAKFIAVEYGKNRETLPRGTYRESFDGERITP